MCKYLVHLNEGKVVQLFFSRSLSLRNNKFLAEQVARISATNIRLIAQGRSIAEFGQKLLIPVILWFFFINLFKA